MPLTNVGLDIRDLLNETGEVADVLKKVNNPVPIPESALGREASIHDLIDDLSARVAAMIKEIKGDAIIYKEELDQVCAGLGDIMRVALTPSDGEAQQASSAKKNIRNYLNNIRKRYETKVTSGNVVLLTAGPAIEDGEAAGAMAREIMIKPETLLADVENLVMEIKSLKILFYRQIADSLAAAGYIRNSITDLQTLEGRDNKVGKRIDKCEDHLNIIMTALVQDCLLTFVKGRHLTRENFVALLINAMKNLEDDLNGTTEKLIYKPAGDIYSGGARKMLKLLEQSQIPSLCAERKNTCTADFVAGASKWHDLNMQALHDQIINTVPPGRRFCICSMECIQQSVKNFTGIGDSSLLPSGSSFSIRGISGKPVKKEDPAEDVKPAAPAKAVSAAEERKKKVLDWVKGLPEVKLVSYARKQMDAMVQFLESGQRPDLEEFFISYLEKIMADCEIKFKNGKPAMSITLSVEDHRALLASIPCEDGMPSDRPEEIRKLEKKTDQLQREIAAADERLETIEDELKAEDMQGKINGMINSASVVKTRMTELDEQINKLKNDQLAILEASDIDFDPAGNRELSMALRKALEEKHSCQQELLRLDSEANRVNEVLKGKNINADDIREDIRLKRELLRKITNAVLEVINTMKSNE